MSTTRPVRTTARRAFTSLWFWFVLAILLSALLAWDGRYSMNEDGMTYVDMAREAALHGPGQLVNGLWNPLYPGFLAVLLLMFHPSPAMEFPLVHFGNFLLFAGVTLSFGLFLKSWLKLESWIPADRQETVSRPLFSVFAFCVFLWCLVRLNGVAIVVPDLLIAGAFFVAAAMVCEIVGGTGVLRHSLLLGAALGAAYYAKSATFPASLLLLLVLCAYSRQAWRQILVAAVVFVVVSAPLVVAISRRVGHLSVGESGTLNYVWHVNNFHLYAGWTDAEGPAHGEPLHPPRKLMEAPLLLEFVRPVPGTYPLWYDPSYWYSGVRASFGVKQQALAILGNLEEYYDIGVEMLPLCAGAIALGFLGRGESRPAALQPRLRWMLVWPLAVFVAYGCVNVEPRYVAPFAVVFWIALYSAQTRCTSDIVARGVLVTITAVLLLSLGTIALSAVHGTERTLRKHLKPDVLVAAEGLPTIGISAGDTIAMVGSCFDAYFAQLAQVRIGAQFPDAEAFWRITPQKLQDAKIKLRDAGIKAIVARDGPEHLPGEGWRELNPSLATRIRVLVLR